MSARFLRFFALAISAAALAGCTTTDDDKCPLASALVDTATLTQLESARPVYTVQVSKVEADCSIAKYEHKVSSSLDIDFAATRPTGGAAASYDVPYFLAITQAGRIIDKRAYSLHIAFDDGQTTASASVSQDTPEFRIEKGKQAFDYAVLVGFQLTKEQLDYNRTAGRYPK